MKSAISRRFMADRGARLAGVQYPADGITGRSATVALLDERSAGATDAEFPLPHALPSSLGRAAAAGVPAPAAFSITCPTVGGQVETAPAVPSLAPAGAVELSEASGFVLTLIAAHQGRAPRDIVAHLISAAGEAIGLSDLLQRGARDIGCLADTPGYARAAANRFRDGVR